jgi:hypothetical protein
VGQEAEVLRGWGRGEGGREGGGVRACACRTSHVTRHTSHVTRHTSYLTRHTSHVTRHTSHVTRHTSHVTRHTSHLLISIPVPQLHAELALQVKVCHATADPRSLLADPAQRFQLELVEIKRGREGDGQRDGECGGRGQGDEEEAVGAAAGDGCGYLREVLGALGIGWGARRGAQGGHGGGMGWGGGHGVGGGGVAVGLRRDACFRLWRVVGVGFTCSCCMPGHGGGGDGAHAACRGSARAEAMQPG